jgi:hypothetical protein
VRDDIKGAITVPKAVQDFLLKLGGKNPFGEPMLRMVYAHSRFVQYGGAQTIWREGSTLRDRGGLIADPDEGVIAGSDRPIGCHVGIHWRRKYPDQEGWLIEKWFPAHLYGSEQAWHRLTAPGTSLPILGPYPVNGDYEAITDSCTYMPTFGEIRTAITNYQFECDQLAQKSDNPEQRALEYSNELEWQQRRQEEQYGTFVQEFLKDFASPLWGSSLAAGRLRTIYAERAGIREHAGN